MRSVSDSPEPFALRLRRLRKARKVSLEDLAYATRDHGPGITMSAVGQLERGVIYPKPETIEMLARALDVDPSEFPEYRLARTRELLDERAVEGGLGQAWANYEEFITGLMLLATQSARELESTVNSESPTAATDAEVRSLLEARKRQHG